MCVTPKAVPTRATRVVRLAAERTYLAWVRTGLALMGFGFVVARFGFFLREIAAVQATPTEEHPTWFSLWVGTGLLLLGVLVSGWSAVRHWRVQIHIGPGRRYPAAGWKAGPVVAVVLVVLGIAMVVYLLTLGR